MKTDIRVEKVLADNRVFIAAHGMQVEVEVTAAGFKVDIVKGNDTLQSVSVGGCESCEFTTRVQLLPDMDIYHPCDSCRPDASTEFAAGLEAGRKMERFDRWFASLVALGKDASMPVNDQAKESYWVYFDEGRTPAETLEEELRAA